MTKMGDDEAGVRVEEPQGPEDDEPGNQERDPRDHPADQDAQGQRPVAVARDPVGGGKAQNHADAEGSEGDQDAVPGELAGRGSAKGRS